MITPANIELRAIAPPESEAFMVAGWKAAALHRANPPVDGIAVTIKNLAAEASILQKPLLLIGPILMLPGFDRRP
ncbi:hypothetical protein AS156_04085 [Bradyrhizobium macuxiense]|uniref:Uncharacterized protein n=1 Tax=Bradyrhizobium macuxiense TaxID=1755647 RepID=A0A109JWU2_9BRAD|nr:hypothetical protein [Bradyrhizobium macuxiense]KWV56588.1 hypothetical protein AS156_04085 [Bradyrhizobium macuxiense]